MDKIWLAPAALLIGVAIVVAGAPGMGRVTAPAPEALRSAPLGDAPNPPAASGVPVAPAAPVVPVAPEVVVRQLTREGYYGFRRVAREGHGYVVHAYDPRGRFVRIVADAGSGRILAARAFADAGSGSQ